MVRWYYADKFTYHESDEDEYQDVPVQSTRKPKALRRSQRIAQKRRNQNCDGIYEHQLV